MNGCDQELPIRSSVGLMRSFTIAWSGKGSNPKGQKLDWIARSDTHSGWLYWVWLWRRWSER
jgi:hypothetical protein